MWPAIAFFLLGAALGFNWLWWAVLILLVLGMELPLWSEIWITLKILAFFFLGVVCDFDWVWCALLALIVLRGIVRPMPGYSPDPQRP